MGKILSSQSLTAIILLLACPTLVITLSLAPRYTVLPNCGCLATVYVLYYGMSMSHTCITYNQCNNLIGQLQGFYFNIVQSICIIFSMLPVSIHVRQCQIVSTVIPYTLATYLLWFTKNCYDPN